MRIRRFEAPDSKTALAMVKAELGDDAVILANRTIPADGGLLRKYGRTAVEVVAATDYDLYSLAGHSDGESVRSVRQVDNFAEEAPREQVSVSGFDEAMQRKLTGVFAAPPSRETKAKRMSWFDKGRGDSSQMQPAAREAKIEKSPPVTYNRKENNEKPKAQQEVNRQKPRAEDVLRWREQLIGQIRYNPLPGMLEGGRQRVVALVGATGVGKTTTVAKIAAWATLRDGLKVALVSMDCFRIGATDQLRTYAKIMRIPCEVALKPQDLRRAVEKHRDCDLVIIDTAGKSPYDDEHIRDLSEWFEAVPEVEPYLAVSATTKKEDMQAVFEMYASLPVKGLVLTKLDETRAYATLCQQTAASGYPVSCLCTGQRVPEDFMLASDVALGTLFRDGWKPFIGAHAGAGRNNALMAGIR